MLIPAFYILLTYLLASAPFGLLLALIVADTDPREAGSHNIGATNVRRLAGDRLGLLTLLADALKGLLPTALAVWVHPSPHYAGLVALTAFVGHSFSVYLDFRGGKGVATAAGVMLALSPLACGVCLGVWLILVRLTRRASVGALIAAPLLPPLLAWLRPELLWVGALLTLGVILNHHENIRRLIHRDEPTSRSDAQKTDSSMKS